MCIIDTPLCTMVLRYSIRNVDVNLCQDSFKVKLIEPSGVDFTELSTISGGESGTDNTEETKDYKQTNKQGTALLKIHTTSPLT